MLDYVADSDFSSAVSWTHDGRAFSIRDKDACMERVVPRFFKQTKFRSFTRQLNLWGFTRLEKTGPDSRTWRHDHFVRGSVDKLTLIERTEVKGTSSKGCSRVPKTSKPKKQPSSANKTKQTAAGRAKSPASQSSLLDAFRWRRQNNGVMAIPTKVVNTLLPNTSAAVSPGPNPKPTMPNTTPVFQSHPQPQTTSLGQLTGQNWFGSSNNSDNTYQHLIHRAGISTSNQVRQNVQYEGRTSNNEDMLHLLSGLNNTAMISQQLVQRTGIDTANRMQQNVQYQGQPSNNDDILDLLSGLFESEENTQSGGAEDSIFSLPKQALDDFIDPISF